MGVVKFLCKIICSFNKLIKDLQRIVKFKINYTVYIVSTKIKNSLVRVKPLSTI